MGWGGVGTRGEREEEEDLRPEEGCRDWVVGEDDGLYWLAFERRWSGIWVCRFSSRWLTLMASNCMDVHEESNGTSPVSQSPVTNVIPRRDA